MEVRTGYGLFDTRGILEFTPNCGGTLPHGCLLHYFFGECILPPTFSYLFHQSLRA